MIMLVIQHTPRGQEIVALNLILRFLGKMTLILLTIIGGKKAMTIHGEETNLFSLMRIFTLKMVT